jgi:hypothetical protein
VENLDAIGTSAGTNLEKTEQAGAEVTEDWAAVARAISDRLEELRATQMEVAARARISLTTLRELQHNVSPRRRRPQTLAVVSEALGWPSDYLAHVLHGEEGDARPHADEEHDPVLTSLTAIERELVDLRGRVDQIEQRLAGGGA